MNPTVPAFSYDSSLRRAMALHGFGWARFGADGIVSATAGAPADWIGRSGANALASAPLVGLEPELERLRAGRAPRLVLPGVTLGDRSRCDISVVWLAEEGVFDVQTRLLGPAAEAEAALARERRARLLAQEQAEASRKETETRERHNLVMRERLRLAHDLHDTMVHALVAVVAQLGLVRKLFARSPPAAGPEIERAFSAARDGLAQAREALGQVRFERAGLDGFGAALGRALDRFETRTGLVVEREIAPEIDSLSGERAEVLFRIVEEALRNVAGHAAASRLRAAAFVRDGEATIRIDDDGRGFDPALARPGHYGLIGMIEQARMIEGAIDIDSAPGAGARVTLRAPLSAAQKGAGE